MELEELMIEFPCPECQERFYAGLHQMVDGGVLICPTCRSSNVEMELDTLERKLRNIGSSIRNLKRCIDTSRPVV
ncbi:hypothetical protein ACFLW1_03060 [Chloroflexota bacterium]